MTDADAVTVGEVEGAARVAVDGYIAQFGDVAAGEELPLFASDPRR